MPNVGQSLAGQVRGGCTEKYSFDSSAFRCQRQKVCYPIMVNILKYNYGMYALKHLSYGCTAMRL